MSPDNNKDAGQPTTVVLCGVGGQGTITAAHLLAYACMDAGFDVKVSEIHGMAQRGGSVSTTVRFGREVHSMVCDPAQADVVISFELVEALRNAAFLACDGHMVVNDIAIRPMSVLTGAAKMPEDPASILIEAIGADAVDVFDATAVAAEAGNPKCANVALLAAAAKHLPIGRDSWERAIRANVPQKALDANLRAFAAMYDR